ncbi:hypothetical protein [Aquirufa sp. TARAVU-A1A]
MFKTSYLSFCLLLSVGLNLIAKPIQLKSYKVGGVHLTGYFPVDQQVYWVRKRPICHSGQSLIVPAAFTHPNQSIAGAAIEWGQTVNAQISGQLNGFCVISYLRPSIVHSNQMNPTKMKQMAKVGNSLFQQDLLVENGHALPIAHAAALNLWRALVIFPDRFEVVENDVNMRRDEFQAALLKIGAQQAIYLDMGTWSEGAYFSPENRVVKIGKMRQNTRRQTNWLVFH